MGDPAGPGRGRSGTGSSPRCAGRAEPVFGLPAGESLRLSLVTGQPWSGYNWYDGGLRSRVDLNVDLPIRGPDLVATLAHETYAGHHLEHAWREAELVERLGRLEASVDADQRSRVPDQRGPGRGRPALILDPAAEAELLVELAVPGRRCPMRATGPRRARWPTGRWPSGRLRTALRAADVDAALMLHVDAARPRRGRPPGSNGSRCCRPSERPRKLEFLEHPLWRTYVFVYADGAELLSALAGRGPGAAIARPASGGCSSSRSACQRSSGSRPSRPTRAGTPDATYFRDPLSEPVTGVSSAVPT